MAAIYILGAGNVGTGFAQSLRRAGLTVTGIWNRSQARADAAALLLGTPVDRGAFGAELSNADLVLVCVADGAVSEVGAALAHSSLRQGCVVAHTSGCLPAAALGAIPKASLGSLHPVAATPKPAGPSDALGMAPSAAFAIEGEPAAVAVLQKVAARLGGRHFVLEAAAKPAYHAACVMAANLATTLLADAIDTAGAAGVPDPQRLLTDLTLGAVQRVAEMGGLAALTGPVLRGDVDTVAKHLATLDPAVGEVYRAVSLRLVALARRRGLPAHKAAELERLLSST